MTIARGRFVRNLGTLTAGTLAVRATVARAATEIVFGALAPGTSEWMIYVAEHQGYFEAEGLHVTTASVGNVQTSINSLATKAVDFVSIGTDSVIAAVAHKLPVKFAMPGYNTMPYGFVVPPEIKRWADLKGKTVAVGAKADVTGILMRIMAKANNLDAERDLNMIVSGSTASRFAALLSGNVEGVFLNPPYDFFAEEKGMRILARASDYAKPWQFTGYAMNVDWVATHRKEAVGIVRAMRKAIAYASTHQAEAIDLLVAATKTSAAAGARAYDLGFVKTKSFDREQRFDEAGVRAVAQGMLGVGTIATVPALTEIIDTSLVAEAART